MGEVFVVGADMMCFKLFVCKLDQFVAEMLRKIFLNLSVIHRTIRSTSIPGQAVLNLLKIVIFGPLDSGSMVNSNAFFNNSSETWWRHEKNKIGLLIILSRINALPLRNPVFELVVSKLKAWTLFIKPHFWTASYTAFATVAPEPFLIFGISRICNLRRIIRRSPIC